MAGYAKDVLVETDWLAEHLEDPSIRVVEVDEDVTAYAKGHIPGAITWDWTTDLQDPIRRDFIDRDGLEALLRRSGVGPETTVVLYGGNNNWFATYAYWLLAYLGFDRAKVLNGGRIKWELESRRQDQEVPTYPATDLALGGEVRAGLRAFRDDVLGAIGSAGFVDVRSPEEFSGEKLAPDHLPQEQPYVGGHVPGATNIPWSKAANEDGTFKASDDLRALYEGAGIASDRATITYCRIGERSSHTWFALHELLGHEQARNYDGSWTEYGSLVGVPVER